MRKKACICKEGWTGPYCKQKDYGDDDARGPIRLPVVYKDFPPSLGVILALLAILLIGSVAKIGQDRGRQEGASSSRGDGYRAVPRG